MENKPNKSASIQGSSLDYKDKIRGILWKYADSSDEPEDNFLYGEDFETVIEEIASIQGSNVELFKGNANTVGIEFKDGEVRHINQQGSKVSDEEIVDDLWIKQLELMEDLNQRKLSDEEIKKLFLEFDTFSKRYGRDPDTYLRYFIAGYKSNPLHQQ